jgi:hypothetical protein
MKFISHRGNLTGPNPERENHPSYILEATANGFEVEIDLWYENGKLILGHDEPQYEVSRDMIESHNFYIHAKNLEALHHLVEKYSHLHFFWHEEDDFTLTSRNFIWTFPEKSVTNRSIIVCKAEEEVERYKTLDCYGICTDYIL